MLKTLIIIALIAGAILAGIAFCAYVLKIDLASNIMNAITTPFSNIFAGGKLDLQTVASGASLATAATSAIGWFKSNKDKALAQAENAKQLVANSGLTEELVGIKAQLEDANKTKDAALQTLETKTEEFKGLANNVAFLENENEKLRQTIDTLHETLRRNKLTDGESIVKTKVI